MARLLAVAVFALAAGCATLASAGLAVAPHAHVTGTTRSHDHVLAAYNYPLFLIRLADRVRDRVRFEAAAPLAEGAAALVLALLVIALARLPRPARRLIAALEVPWIPAAQQRSAPPPGPPRRGVGHAPLFA